MHGKKHQNTTQTRLDATFRIIWKKSQKKEQDTLALRPPEAGLNKQRDKWPFETWLYTEFQNLLGNGYWPNHLPTPLKQGFNFCIILQNYNSPWINKCQLKSSWKWIHWMGNQEIRHWFWSKQPCLIVYCNFHNIFIGNSKPLSIWNCNIWPPFQKLDFAVRDIIDFTIVVIECHYFHRNSPQNSFKLTPNSAYSLTTDFNCPSFVCSRMYSAARRHCMRKGRRRNKHFCLIYSCFCSLCCSVFGFAICRSQYQLCLGFTTGAQLLPFPYNFLPDRFSIHLSGKELTK